MYIQRDVQFEVETKGFQHHPSTSNFRLGSTNIGMFALKSLLRI